LEEGAKWTSQTANAEQSQMIESLYHGIEEVCRLYRMPPHKVQHLLRATFSNIESQALEYVVDCLLGWAVRWEQEIYRKLLLPRERETLFAKHNFNMLLRGDSASRSTFYRELFNIGVLSPNDIRDKEDLNPVDGGDTYFVNAATIPLEMAATGEHLKQKEPAPAAKPAEDKPEPEAPQALRSDREHRAELVGRVGAAHLPVIERALAGLLRNEHSKVTRAIHMPAFNGWEQSFYTGPQPKEVVEKLSPSIAALCTSLEAVAEGAT
jgi:hypothetical protein